PPFAPLAGSYSGAALSFGITNYGEVMPFQYPVGNEHLAVGWYVSGYTVAYGVGGQDHVCYAVNYDRSCITPVSYTELRNTPDIAEVEVATRTSDGVLGITQHFTFLKSKRYVAVTAVVTNLTDTPAPNVVFKREADWDVDDTPEFDTWDYDTARNM